MSETSQVDSSRIRFSRETLSHRSTAFSFQPPTLPSEMNEQQVRLFRGQGRILTLKTSLFMLMMWLPLFMIDATAFVVPPNAKRMVFFGAHKLWGNKGRIQRVGTRDDSDEATVRTSEEEEGTPVEIKVPSMSLDELLLPSANCNVNQVGPTALAYIGDVVFELMVRARHVWPARRTSDLQQQVVALVRGVSIFGLIQRTALHVKR